MGWIKNVLLDILVTAVIAIYVFSAATWGYWIILIYTPFMLLLKLVAVLSASATPPIKKKAVETAPVWFFHVLYGINLVLLLKANWWIMAIGWAAIWILSAVHESRMPKKEKA